MGQKKDSISGKLKRITDGKPVSDSEFECLREFVEKFGEDEDIDQWLREEWEMAEGADDRIPFSEIKEKLFPEGDKPGTKQYRRGEGLLIYLRKPVVAAASVLVLFLCGWWGFNWFRQSGKNEKSTDLLTSDIKGKVWNNVTLSKGGRTYVLSPSEIQLADSNVSLHATSSLLKVEKSSGRTKTEQEPQWQTITVPVGKDYYVELSDGTQIWVNANSRLSFPDFFSARERRVKIEGEACFEVVSDASNPFFVETPSSVVKVTGTLFDVCAYQDELKNSVTLVRGKVTVEMDGKEHFLNKGEQFVQDNETNTVSIKKVDAGSFISWRDGVFEFKDMPLRNISYRLQNWYGVQFEFESAELSQLRFTGMVKKEYEIDYFLEVLEKTTNVLFTRRDATIVVHR
jgi:hypothetical protein